MKDINEGFEIDSIRGESNWLSYASSVQRFASIVSFFVSTLLHPLSRLLRQLPRRYLWLLLSDIYGDNASNPRMHEGKEGSRHLSPIWSTLG